ncbi:hypothetical protein FH972_026478 [Carpinus fangiana]|uniref:Uncharacterized protein n=1 Tax=Carpinus fangiana TaxID=176857 RepID=A0A5N6L432_9ROSI|nr:hypothetical protein FH972_026478 [Carpinus fangiana]
MLKRSIVVDISCALGGWCHREETKNGMYDIERRRMEVLRARVHELLASHGVSLRFACVCASVIDTRCATRRSCQQLP